jgi:transposase
MLNRRYDTDLTDAAWELVKPLLPGARHGGRPRTDVRAVVNAIFYLLRTGCQWRLLPHQFPRWGTVYHYFRSSGELWNLGAIASRHLLLTSVLKGSNSAGFDASSDAWIRWPNTQLPPPARAKELADLQIEFGKSRGQRNSTPSAPSTRIRSVERRCRFVSRWMTAKAR